MTKLFENLVSTMQRKYVDRPEFSYIEPCTGEDIYEDVRYYYWTSSIEDFVESVEKIEVPSETSDDVKVLKFGSTTTIWVGDEIALDIDHLGRRVVIYDYESIEDRHLYALINLARKEVLVPSR